MLDNKQLQQDLAPAYAVQPPRAAQDSAYRDNRTLPVQKISFSILLLLTFGFIAYETAINLEMIPPFLGGYIGVVTITLAPIALLCYFSSLGTSVNQFTIGDTCLALVTCIVAGVAALHLGSYGYVGEVAESHFVTVAQFITFFVAFKLLPVDDPAIHRIIIILAVLTSLMVFNANLGATDSEHAQVNLDLADYQQFAVYYLILMIVTLVFIRNIKWRLVFYAIGIIVLFYNGARTEFIGWFVVIGAIEAVRSRRAVGLMVLALALFLPLAGGAITLLGEYLPENRVTSLIENASYDQSYVERQEILDRTIVTISEDPITGNYAQYDVGRYAHSALSIWQDFGIFSFILFVGSLALALFSCIGAYSRGHLDADLMLFAAIIMIAVIFFAFSKAFSHPIYPMAMAMYARERMRASSNRHPGR